MHIPVMMNEVLSFSADRDPQHILDGTFGRGGHTRALLLQHPRAKVTAFDQDEQAIEYGKSAMGAEIQAGRLSLHHFNFHDVARFKEIPEAGFDIVLLDLGVSSPQLDESERGFSFYHDGPLDMRMDRSRDLTAAEVINTWPEVELFELFQKYGEVSRPGRVVRAILNDRAEKPFTSTVQLSSMIERVDGWHKKGQHPATKYFLALRMAVNRELSGLENCIPDFMRVLSPTGRLIVITFHSLEDRIIKYAFKGAPELGFPLTKRVVVPSEEEQTANPRARSAKLRVFQRGNADDPQKYPRDTTIF